MAIPQGTTPTHTFILPIDTSDIHRIRIVYSQCGEVLFTRESQKGEVTIEGSKVITTLTQEETFKIDHEKVVEIQLRVATHADEVANSQIIRVSAERCLDSEVL